MAACTNHELLRELPRCQEEARRVSKRERRREARQDAAMTHVYRFAGHRSGISIYTLEAGEDSCAYGCRSSSSCSWQLWTAAAMHAQIANPIPAPVEKRGLMVEISGSSCACPDTRGMRPADQDVDRRPAGRASVTSATFRTAAGSPTTRAAFCICSIATTSRRCTRTSPPPSRSPSTTGWRADSSDSTSTRSSRRTASSTRCTASARWATRRRPTSSRPGSRRRT